MSTENLSQSGKEEALVSFGDIEKLELRGMLYDFYGELLTPHQKKIYEDAIVNDLSLSEIANEQGISRQGVHDIIKRCDKALAEYEEKLHLVEKFLSIREQVRRIKQIAATYQAQEITEISNEILEEL